MNTYLLAATPFAGHIHPMLGLARALIGRGHRVIFYTGEKYRRAVEDSGSEWAAWTHAQDFDDQDPAASFPAMARNSGLGGVLISFRDLFFGTAAGQARDILAIHEQEGIDAMVAEGTCFGPSLAHDLAGIPYATFSLSPLALPSRELPPAGVPFRPGRSRIGRLRDAALRGAVDHTINKVFRRWHNQARAVIGLPQTKRLGVEGTWSRQLLLAQGVQELETPRSDLPEYVRFIGDAAAGTRTTPEPPSWLEQLDGSRPVIHVSQGTLAEDGLPLTDRVMDAVRGLDVHLVVGGRERSADTAARIVAAPWVPQDQLFPRTDLFVSNGGYGGVLAALSHGVPVLVVPGGGDKQLVAHNVAHSGAGVVLSPRRASVDGVREAMSSALADPNLKRRAVLVAHAMATAGGAPRAAEYCESLIAPVEGPSQ